MLNEDPLNYDAWFEYAKLEEEHGNATTTRDVYERAISHIPPKNEKRHWKRYIYLYTYYSIYEEMEMNDLDMTRMRGKSILLIEFGVTRLKVFRIVI